MSTRYVWKKYNKTGGINAEQVYQAHYISPSGSDDIGAFAGYVSGGPTANGINAGTLNLNQSDAKAVYVGGHIDATSVYHAIAPAISNNTFLASKSVSSMNTGHWFWELYPYNSVTHEIGVRLWRNNNNNYADYSTDNATWQQFTVRTLSSQDYSNSNLVGTVSSSDSTTYPNDSASGNYWYVYQGSDNIDPISIYTNDAIAPNKIITVRIEPSSSNTYGGTITYTLQYALNGSSSWTNMGTTTSTSSTLTLPSNVKSIQFRVVAQDNMGFTSTTYVTSSVYSVENFTISVNASPSAGGTVSGGGTFASGESVTVSATANKDYKFSHWLEGSSQVSTSASYTFTATKSRTLMAVFISSITYYTVAVSASPSAGGTVSGGGQYTSGTSITVRATPRSGYGFTGWFSTTGVLQSNSNAYSFSVTRDTTLTAQFYTQETPTAPTEPTGSEIKPYIGINDIANKVNNIYIGIENKAKKIKKGYIGVDGKARLFYSEPKPLVWSEITLPISSYWQSVAYGNGLFVAVSYMDNSSIYSEDGKMWYTSTLPTSRDGYGDIAYGNGLFVSINKSASSPKAAYSADGKNWGSASVPSSYVYKSIAFGDGKFVSVGTEGSVCSSDGKTWEKSDLPSASRSWEGVSYGNGLFVAIDSYNSPKRMAYSANGINWTETYALPTYSRWNSITYGNGIFVAISSGSDDAAWSKDGKNWEKSTLPSSVSWNRVSYGNGLFVATANNSDIAAYSTEGKKWRESKMPYVASWNCIAYGNGIFVAHAYNNNIGAYAEW